MEKRATQHGSRRTREAHRAQSTNAGGEPPRRPEFAIFMWLLDPRQRDAMRRRIVDGKGGVMERWVWTFAYSRPPAQEHGIVGMRFMTIDQVAGGEANKPGPKYLNLPPGVVAPAGRPPGDANNSWEDLAGRLHRAAWTLVRDPKYVEALHRRIEDGRAPAMERLLCETADLNARKPHRWRPRRWGTLVSTFPFWFMDPLAQAERILIKVQEANEELEARTKQAAAVAVPPDEPMELVLVDLPELEP